MIDSLLEALEERFNTITGPARNYRALQVSEKLVKIHAMRKERRGMTTGNKSYNRKGKKKSKVTSK